jgi:hypothetical protein
MTRGHDNWWLRNGSVIIDEVAQVLDPTRDALTTRA